ncbi:unnamed protein product [Meloidogyne enterolobii]|uniref:Uncharacterized protein n=1 Tax=Meloidogyne enterolobii TaxID=390850 RepID=A0ACB0YGD0_MELEN
MVVLRILWWQFQLLESGRNPCWGRLIVDDGVISNIARSALRPGIKLGGFGLP